MGNRKLLILAAICGLASSTMLVGCGREVSHTEDTHVSSDGSVKTKEKTVTENPDGTVTKTETKKPDKP